MTAFTERAREILDHPEIATVATIQPDGSPQLSPVWIKRDGDDLLFSTTAGRRKPANLARDPRITVLVWPSYSPYEYVEVRGTATITPDPEGALINELSLLYTGDPWTDKPGTERLIVRVTPRKVVVR